MDLDAEFVQAVIREGKPAYLAAIDRGVDPEIHLFGPGKTAWQYVVTHWKQFAEVPELDTVLIKTGLDLSSQMSETSSFFLEELFNRRTAYLCHEGAKEVVGKLDSRDPKGAAEALSEAHKKIQKEQLTDRKIESLLSLGKDVIKSYDDAKAGVRGIQTPWPTMNEQTLGWWPEDLALFVGRLGVGKTWTLLLCAHAAWASESSPRILLISTEMNKVKMAMRFFSLHLRMPYDDIRRGRLGEFVEEKFYAGVREVMDSEGFNIVSGDFVYTIDNVEAAIEADRPDVLFVDGAYLIKNSGKDRHERVSNTFDDFKRLGKRYKHATVTNMQFNRSAKTGQGNTIAAENIGITDVAGWNADVSYGLLQTEDMRAAWEMGVKALKIREGKPDEFKINWNHEAMDFSEKPADGAQPSSQPVGGGADSSYASDGDGYDDVPF
jgi:replicative DNA helicase